MRWIVISVIIASANGFKIENTQAIRNGRLATVPVSTLPPAAAFGGRPPSSGLTIRPTIVYPKVPPPNARESGGREEDLLPPLEGDPKTLPFRRSIQDVKKDPKTGYPLEARPSWKDAGGNERHLELPLEEPENGAGQVQGAVDPKTGYPLVAEPHWKHAGGDERVILLPFEGETPSGEESEAVDPKTGYPLVAQPGWKDAGGNELILELPLEDLEARAGNEEDEAVDPKTGYPLVAQPGWKDAGGDGEILELPSEDADDRSPEQAVDPKTGYPLAAEPSWKYAGGDEEILELPLEDPEEAVDPKTGYPLAAQPGWKDAGGDGDILQPPLEEVSEKSGGGGVDPKTGYPLAAQPGWKDAGGDGEILEPPLEDPEDAVDPKTGYPLVARPGWKDAGGNENILRPPLEEPAGNSVAHIEGRSGVLNVAQLRQLLPPSEEKYYPLVFRYPLSTPAPIQRSIPPTASVLQRRNSNQKRDSFPTLQQDANRPVESSYTYTGPENVVVTVTRYLNTDLLQKPTQTNGFTGFGATQNDRTNRQKNFQKPSSVEPNERLQFNQGTFPRSATPRASPNLNRNPS